ncbi:MAG: four helix bundle protein [Chitinophagales bacterium]|nr:four helix bundle protein [Chitinophagales bacterium]
MSKSNRKPAQVLEDRLIDFATRILDLVEALPNTAVGRHMGGQIMRSGTAPALNYGEAQAAESKADFVHKMKICLKELRETNISLKIIFRRNWFPKEKLNPIMDENNELIAIFMASIKTALTQSKHL